jgi:hypothetical protein
VCPGNEREKSGADSSWLNSHARWVMVKDHIRVYAKGLATTRRRPFVVCGLGVRRHFAAPAQRCVSEVDVYGLCGGGDQKHFFAFSSPPPSRDRIKKETQFSSQICFT